MAGAVRRSAFQASGRPNNDPEAEVIEHLVDGLEARISIELEARHSVCTRDVAEGGRNERYVGAFERFTEVTAISD